MVFTRLQCLLAVICIQVLLSQVGCELIILNLRDESTIDSQQIQKQICAIKRDPKLNISLDYTNVHFNLINLTPYNGCLPLNQTFTNNKSAIFTNIVPPVNCSLATILYNLQESNTKVAIIGSNGPIKTNLTDVSATVSAVLLPQRFSDVLSAFIAQSQKPTVEIEKLSDKFEPAMIIIWFAAIGTVILGSLWSSHDFKQSLIRTSDTDGKHDGATGDGIVNEGETKSKRKDSLNEEPSLIAISYLGIFVLLIFVVGILLLLYFFYNVMIYFVYVIFCIGATVSMYRILKVITTVTNFARCRIPANNLPLLKSRPAIIDILFACISITISALWFAYRHENWIWTIQNVMAVSLAANALSCYRLSSYKIVTIMLIVFFLYDVFMVFISPLITKGTSIMEAVAFGGRTSDSTSQKNEIEFDVPQPKINRLPVVVIIPRLSKVAQMCSYYIDYSFSLLGLGDMLIPGLSVNYAILFDLATGNKRFKIYFFANILAYGLGLFLAFIGLIFMDKAQPALFYLCPSHLIVTYIIALIRKDVRKLWSGEPIAHYIEAKKADQLSPNASHSNSMDHIIEGDDGEDGAHNDTNNRSDNNNQQNTDSTKNYVSIVSEKQDS